MEKGKLIGIYVLLAAILISVIGSVVVGGQYLDKKMKSMDKQMTKILEKDKQEDTKEDDVVIASEYTIKSTKKISDAYLQEINAGKDNAKKDDKKDDSKDKKDKKEKKIKLNDKEQKTLDMAKKVIDKVIKENMTPYEKEVAIYEWICKNISTGNTSLLSTGNDAEAVSTPYGVLKGHNAVCVGYATTFRMFMHMLGIECKVVHNTENYHSWDEVKLDGDWYFVDCYSDSENCNYANFNMNDDLCSRGHEWDRNYFPAAVGTKYNYAVMNAKPCDDVFKLPKKIRKSFEKGAKKPVAFNLGKGVDENTEWILSEMASKIQELVNNNYPADVTFGLIETDAQEKIFSMTVNLYNNNSNNGESQLSEKDQKKLQEAFDKAFSNYNGEGLNSEEN
ncbi:Transglutaminase-like superfamily protein [Lachnospiraceae bacterium XBB1006]|nr:Transglutaminase-like superfamily protein [Lachnospiraceae bacterium XBB1006]